MSWGEPRETVMVEERHPCAVCHCPVTFRYPRKMRYDSETGLTGYNYEEHGIMIGGTRHCIAVALPGPAAKTLYLTGKQCGPTLFICAQCPSEQAIAQATDRWTRTLRTQWRKRVRQCLGLRGPAVSYVPFPLEQRIPA